LALIVDVSSLRYFKFCSFRLACFVFATSKSAPAPYSAYISTFRRVT
jgi:hypothetical protein